MRSIHNPAYLPTHATQNGELQPWARSHIRAMTTPLPVEAPIVNGLDAWLAYAEQAKKYGHGIGEDYVLGDPWAAWGFALLELLNGATGRLDCGTLDAILRDTLEAEGWDTDSRERKS